MKSLPAFIAVFCCMFCACKKESNVPEVPEGNPNNQVTATVSINAGPDSSFQAKGNRTLFARRIDRGVDTIVVITGSMGEYGTYSSRGIQITLVNITTPGAYAFDVSSSVKTKAFCDYSIGDVFFSTIYRLYSTQTSSQPGNITIDAISASSIRGSFTANCANYVQINKGSFKGEF